MHRTSQQRPMGSPKIVALVYCAFLAGWGGSPGYPHSGSRASTRQDQPSTGKQAGVPTLPQGKKLLLKNGNFQHVPNYTGIGERGRFLSAERCEWEDVPAGVG